MSINGPGSYGGGSGAYFKSDPNAFKLGGVRANIDPMMGNPQQVQNGMQGLPAGLMGGLRDFGIGTLTNQLFGSRGGPLATLGQYGLRQGLGGAGMKALGMAIPGVGQAQMIGALLPAALGGLSSLGRSLGIGRRTGPSPEELAMGESKANLANMRGSFGADMATGQSMLDRYNPMLEAQISRMQDLANRGLSTDYNTRQMAGAASTTEAARRAAESRMRATGSMMGGGQALAGYGGINQAAVGGMAQGAYNAAINDMNQQPGYINQLSGMIGSQINRGQGLFNTGRAGTMGIDQQMYSLNAQEKARADALAQANRDREAAAIGGIAQMGMSYLGDQANERQMNRLMEMYGMGNEGGAMKMGPQTPLTQVPGQVPINLSNRPPIELQGTLPDGVSMPQIGNRIPRMGNMQLATGPLGAYQSPMDPDPTYGFGSMGPRGVRSSLYPDPSFGIGRFAPSFRL